MGDVKKPLSSNGDDEIKVQPVKDKIFDPKYDQLIGMMDSHAISHKGDNPFHDHDLGSSHLTVPFE